MKTLVVALISFFDFYFGDFFIIESKTFVSVHVEHYQFVVRQEESAASLGLVFQGVALSDLKDFLVNRARSLIYTTAPPPAIAGAVLAALEIVESDPERRARLHANARHLRQTLRELGFEVPDDPTPIVPLLLGDNERTLRWSKALWEAGFWVHPIRPPTVPDGTSRLRITVTSEQTFDQIDALAKALATLLKDEA